MLYKSSDLNIKDVDTRKGIVTGYFASFNTQDSDGDVIRPGAFVRSIQENGPNSLQPRILHLMDHDLKKRVGKLLVLKEDGRGLYYESQIGKHALGQDFLKMAESGLITEHSIGYIVPKDKEKYNTYLKANEIFEVNLKEGSSLQAWGANPDTPLLGIKSDQQLIDTMDVLTRALKTGNYTDETYRQLEARSKTLGELIEQRHLAAVIRRYLSV